MIISNCPKEHIYAAAEHVGVSITYCDAKSSSGLRHLVKLKPSQHKLIKVQAGERLHFKVSADLRSKLAEAFDLLGFNMGPQEFLRILRIEILSRQSERLPNLKQWSEPIIAQGEKLARLILGEMRPKHKRIANFQRRSISNRDRACAAVCWHGFKFFFVKLFELQPTARCKTAYAYYNGQQQFLEKYPATAYRDIGSRMNPLTVTDACWCEDLEAK